MSISINEDIRHIVEVELQAGEKLLWADRPDKRAINLTCLAVFFTFIIPALFLTVGGLWFLIYTKFVWWGFLPLICGGIIFVEGIKVIRDTQLRIRDIYMITNKRVISKVYLGKAKHTIVNLRRGGLTFLSRKPKFGTAMFTFLTQPLPTEQSVTTLFAFIKNSEHVEKLLLEFIA